MTCPRLIEPRSKTCGPFRDAIEFGNLSSTYKSYEYCRQWPTDTNVDYRGCTDCLQAAESFHLANCELPRPIRALPLWSC